MKSVSFQAILFELLFVVPSLGSQSPAGIQKIHLGQFQSRAIVKKVETYGRRAPIVIMIPGSGPNGPEETMPSFLTLDGKDHALFDELAEPLNAAGVHTMQLGKPGVEFSNGVWNGDKPEWYYDQELYDSLKWNDLVSNVLDAISYARAQSYVDPNRVYLLGHSEGTHVAIDVCAQGAGVKGLILLGFSGVSYRDHLDWQLFVRPVELLFRTHVDQNSDGIISRQEWEPWKDQFPFLEFSRDEKRLSFRDIETRLRANATLKAEYEWFQNSTLLQNGIFDRKPLFTEAARLTQSISVFNGELDVQTPLKFASPLIDECRAAGKSDCQLTSVTNVGHGFSVPRPPRSHILLDATVGPIQSEFKSILRSYAATLTK